MEQAINRVNNWIALNDPHVVLDLTRLDLKQLPPIPLNCERLICYNNQLTSLPQLPNCMILSCFSNKLTSLPELPKCRSLFCYNNQLTSLPQLPNCETLYCFNNHLTYLPQLLKCTTSNIIDRNKYLYIDKYQAKQLGIDITKNYNSHATIIQKNYKKYLRQKYHNIINQYLFVGPSKLVCLYSI